MSFTPANGAVAEADEMINIAIRPDRVFQKSVLVRGDYRLFPREGARVNVRISEVCFSDASGTCDVDSLSKYFRSDFDGRFEIGDADYYIDEGLERCLQSMSRKEKSVLRLEYRDVEGKLGRAVTCRVELLDTTDEDAICDWEWTRQFEYAERHNKRGVVLVREHRTADAFRQFAKAFKFIMSTEPYDTEKIPTVKFADLMILKAKLMGNIAHCQLHFEDYAATVQVCDKLLYLDDNNIKALFRRACARMGLQEWEAAYEDMQLVLRFEPNNKEVLAKLNIIKPKVKIVRDNYNSVIKKMFA